MGAPEAGLSFRNALVGSGWATALLLCTNGLRKQSSHPAQRPILAGKPFSPVWASGCRVSAVIILLVVGVVCYVNFVFNLVIEFTSSII